MTNNMKKFGWVLFFCAGSLLAEPQNFSENGVEGTVEEGESTLKGFKAFKITVKNTAESDKSLNAKIYLQNSTKKMPKGGAGDCQIFISLDPGEEKTEEKQCKEKEASDQWSFEVVKVYNFKMK